MEVVKPTNDTIAEEDEDEEEENGESQTSKISTDRLQSTDKLPSDTPESSKQPQQHTENNNAQEPKLESSQTEMKHFEFDISEHSDMVSATSSFNESEVKNNKLNPGNDASQKRDLVSVQEDLKQNCYEYS
ncbi:Hypothetical predicted protein [Mytilus galloprovincialis]|uniref:Uncharacterized protein n=1 Tax=Mytilus galloprovincialis TaxID=29158 RepID=A0A8B6GJH0_MYTGA|nr:Hypothetical predicted protein [Mytilus galloprovincialis]